MHANDNTLTNRLDAFRAGMLLRLPEAERLSILNAAEDLRATSASRTTPGEGERAPRFALPDQHGRIVRLEDRLAQGPVVAYQDALPAMHAAGAELLAITPQPADRCSAVAERDLLSFPVLSDKGNVVADSYGIAYELAPALRRLYARLGHDLPRLNGTGDWRVPLPATFVLDPDGRVVHASVEPVAHRRLEPDFVVQVLDGLRVPA